jgi:hypothetical protein
MESEGDNFSDISKQSMEGSWQPMIPLNDKKWKDHLKWLKNWKRLAPKSKSYVKRPFSAKTRRKIKYQTNVVREWKYRFCTVFEENYTNVEADDIGRQGMDALKNGLVDERKEECKALKDKKRKHHEEGADNEFGEHLAKRPQLPPKKKDPGRVTIICQIGKAGVNALCDVGSSLNVIPLSLADKFNLTIPTAGIARELVLANQSTIHLVGTVEDVLVKVKDREFLVDFLILDIGEDEDHPIILGRPFLETSRALIDMDLAEMTLRSEDKATIIKTSNAKKDECYKLE